MEGLGDVWRQMHGHERLLLRALCSSEGCTRIKRPLLLLRALWSPSTIRPAHAGHLHPASQPPPGAAQQAEAALLQPARARVVLRERRRRPGRTNKADIYYQVRVAWTRVCCASFQLHSELASPSV